jgi:hypothetical protein
VWKCISNCVKKSSKKYDAVLGFLEKSPVYYAIEKVDAVKKIGFIHNDYEKLEMDKNIDLVTLIGRAGTGKSLIVLASALELVISKKEYDRFIIYRPIQPVGNDIGYLPGTMEEKLAPWFQRFSILLFIAMIVLAFANNFDIFIHYMPFRYTNGNRLNCKLNSLTFIWFKMYVVFSIIVE